MIKDIIFVLGQFVLFALYFIDYELFDLSIDVPNWLDIVFLIITGLGGLLIVLGILSLNENLTPFPTPKKNSNLISTGIYKYIRHPIYAGILIAMMAFGLYSGSISRILITGLLLLVLYLKTEYEERLLVEKFPSYNLYRKTTGRFFPSRNRNKTS